MKSDWDVFVFAGEASADLHGAKVLESLYKKRPGCKVFGVGGPKMRSQGMHCIKHMEDFEVMGFIDVLLVLPKLMKLFYFIAKQVLKAQPKVVLLIDYPGWNLRFASYLRKKKYAGKICQYISPTVWAWKKDRMQSMAQNLDVLFSILPFEVDFFSKTPLQVVYVGHPLVQKMEEEQREEIPELENKRCIALFPGSREQEITRNLPIQLEAARKIFLDNVSLVFAVSVSHEKFLPLLQKIVQEETSVLDQKFIYVPPEKTYALMQSAELAIAKSGTVTLELALHKVYTVVCYAVTSLDYFLAKYVFKINLPFYCIVNILCNKKVFPEFIGPFCTQKNVYEAASFFLQTPVRKKEFLADYEKLTALLGKKRAGEQVALHIGTFLD